MYVLASKIQINSQSGQTISYDYISGVKIVTSLRQLTDTCTLTVPRKVKHQGKDITAFVARGDAVTVELGYGDSLKTVFQGYIKRIKTGMPITLECENEAWKLKQTTVPPTLYPSLKLSQFVSEHLGGYATKVADANLGEVRIQEEASIAKVLDYFTQNYPLRFFFREGTFYAGLPSALSADDAATVQFDTGMNFVKDALKIRKAEDVHLQIVAKAVLPDNTKIEHKEPASATDAEVRTYYVPGAETVDDLKAFAKEKLSEDKADRMEGTLTAFGQPFVRKGDVIHLFDENNKERNDKKYLAGAVTYTFGQGGYRQKITLGNQIK